MCIALQVSLGYQDERQYHFSRRRLGEIFFGGRGGLMSWNAAMLCVSSSFHGDSSGSHYPILEAVTDCFASSQK
jgi:hypothetical protein